MTQSSYRPDNTRRLQLEGFIGSVCVCSTGRLGIVTHVAVSHGSWNACGFGLDGKGVWTSGSPIEIARAEDFFNKLNDRFDGKLCYHDMASMDIKRFAELVVEKLDRAGVSAPLFDFDSIDPPKFVDSGDDDNADVDRKTGQMIRKINDEVMSQIEAGADNALGLGASAEVVSHTNKTENGLR